MLIHLFSFNNFFYLLIIYFFKIKNSLLDPEGPFSLMNALKPIEPGEIHHLIICFTPNKSCIVRKYSVLSKFKIYLKIIYII